MNCPKCNQILLPNANFCGSCGYQMPAASSPSMQNQPQANFANQQQPFNSGNQPSDFGNQQSQGRGAFQFDADGRGQGRGYTWEIKHPGSFALAVVNLQPEQSISAEAGAMVSMSANVELQSQMKGGLMGALKRAVGGESASSRLSRRGAAPAKSRSRRARPVTSPRLS